MTNQRPTQHYRGRFAPSPTGPLHMGSLLTALASYLDARQRQGEWLVRMEDLDPPREQPGAADRILTSLEVHGLLWDESVLYQHDRHPRYAECLEHLLSSKLAYLCNCSRRQISDSGGIYSGRCRQTSPDRSATCAVRLKTHNLPECSIGCQNLVSYHDLLQGNQQQDIAREVGDFVIFRKDGLFAYQLAVVIDDIDQGISHVIRGCDLLDNTPRQLWIYHLLGATPPQFGHIPILVNDHGQKLSKQTFAPALDDRRSSANVVMALTLLNHPPPAELHGASPTELLHWACTHWRREQLPAGLSLTSPRLPKASSIQ